MTTRRGVTYWPTYEEARAFCEQHGLKTYGRIIAYKLGWAIQLRLSGPYVNAADYSENGGA